MNKNLKDILIEKDKEIQSPPFKKWRLMVDTIRGAKQQILVQAYSFSSPPIATALVSAKKKGEWTLRV